jgi:hypothetical protein
VNRSLSRPITCFSLSGTSVRCTRGGGTVSTRNSKLVVATKLSKMILKCGETLTLTPLLAKLIVEKALRTKSVDPNFDEISTTVPEAYLEYIRFVGSKSTNLLSPRVGRARLSFHLG